MPWKKKSSRSRPVRRRKYVPKKRGFRKSKSTAGVPSQYPAFPANKVVKMRYVDSFVTPTAANSYNFQVNATSIHDPQVSAGGHRPLGTDQWQQFYNQYLIIGAKITVQVTGTVSTNNAPMIGIYLSDDTTLTAVPNLIQLAEQGKCRYRLHNGFQNIGTTTLTQYYSPKKFFNITDIKDNLDRLGANFGANPTENAIFNIIFDNVDPTVNLSALACIFTVDYLVLLSEPKELPQST